VSEDEFRDHIRAMIGYHGGKRVWARDLAKRFGVSQSYFSDVLNGNRGIADKLANAAGYRRVVTFEPIDPTPTHKGEER